MTLHELITTNEWLSVEYTFLKLYPDQAESVENYRNIYSRLRQANPIRGEIQIVLEQCYDDETGEVSHVDVSGRNQTTPENELTESLAIEFVPWTEWLGMTIYEKTLWEFNELEILSHCLFEMTFVSFDEEEIQTQLASLKKTMEEYRSMTNEEKQAKTKTLEDFLKELDGED